MRVVDRTWHAICNCGADLGDTMGPLIDNSYDQAGRLHQKHLVEAIRAALADAGLLVQPGGETRTWSVPAEPGYEVTALRCDCHARIWHHDGTMWRSQGWPFEHFRWPGLLANHPKLTDATQEAPHAPAPEGQQG